MARPRGQPPRIEARERSVLLGRLCAGVVVLGLGCSPAAPLDAVREPSSSTTEPTSHGGATTSPPPPGTTSGMPVGTSGTTTGANLPASTTASSTTGRTAGTHDGSGTSGDTSLPTAGDSTGVEVESPCPRDGSPCALLPLGDSITFGEGSSGGGYRVALFRRATLAGQSITFVGTAAPNGPDTVEGLPFPRNHQGHQGYVIDQGGFSPTASLSRVLDDVLPGLSPDIVLLMIGTNDVNGNVDLPEAPARLTALVETIVASEPDALVVVAQLPPTRDPVLNDRIEAYNAGVVSSVEALAASGSHVTVVDMFTPFDATPDYPETLLFDRLHPNDAGYAVMADVWYEAIAAVLTP